MVNCWTGRMVRCGLLVLAGLAGVGGCNARKTYPEPPVGWHTLDYSVIFGRLQQIPAKDPDSAPVWVVRYGEAGDPYGGQLALTPPEELVGFSGGERVEVRGSVNEQLAHPDYAGKWYVVRSIRIWQDRR